MPVPRKAPVLFRVLLFHLELAALAGTAGLALLGLWPWTAVCAALAVVAHLAGRTLSHRTPLPMPYMMRWVLHLPRGFQSPERLRRSLLPRAGERVLEIGPGVGIHALSMAARLLPEGVLDVLDAQPEMLDAIIRRAAGVGVTNIRPARGDAHRLPYPDATFDAAYMIGVLGEIPDQGAAMRELRRVLKPGGRVLIAEVLIDPDFVPFTALRRLGEKAGLSLIGRTGPGFSYMALLRPLLES